MLFSPTTLSLETSVQAFQAFMVDLMSLAMLDESPISLGALIVSKQETLTYNSEHQFKQWIGQSFSLPIRNCGFICQKLIFGSLSYLSTFYVLLRKNIQVIFMLQNIASKYSCLEFSHYVRQDMDQYCPHHDHKRNSFK